MQPKNCYLINASDPFESKNFALRGTHEIHIQFHEIRLHSRPVQIEIQISTTLETISAEPTSISLKLVTESQFQVEMFFRERSVWDLCKNVISYIFFLNKLYIIYHFMFYIRHLKFVFFSFSNNIFAKTHSHFYIGVLCPVVIS